MLAVINKTCPFNEKRMCDKNCQLYINQKCAITVIADSLVRTEKTLQKIEKEQKSKEN